MFVKESRSKDKKDEHEEVNEILEFEWDGNLSHFIDFLRSGLSPKMGRVANMLFDDLYTNERDELVVKRRRTKNPEIVHVGDLITYDPGLDVDSNYFITRKAGKINTNLPFTFFRHDIENQGGYLSHLLQFMSMDTEGIDQNVTITLIPQEGLIKVTKGEEVFEFDPRVDSFAYEKETQKYYVCDKSYADIIF